MGKNLKGKETGKGISYRKDQAILYARALPYLCDTGY